MKRGYVVLLLVGLGIALVITLFSPLASSKPDGLERVAEDKAFIDKGKDAPYEVIGDYAFPWVGNEDVATILGGVVGVAVVAAFVLAVGVGLRALSRRVAIATVLAMEPAVLALDEPSSGLDPRSRRALIRLLRELPQAMLVATHDMHLVRDLLPRTVILDAGLVVADGATSEILRDMHLLEEHGLEAPQAASASGAETGKRAPCPAAQESLARAGTGQGTTHALR